MRCSDPPTCVSTLNRSLRWWSRDYVKRYDTFCQVWQFQFTKSRKAEHLWVDLDDSFIAGRAGFESREREESLRAANREKMAYAYRAEYHSGMRVEFCSHGICLGLMIAHIYEEMYK